MLFPEERRLEVRIKIKMVIHIQYLDERNPVVFSFYVDRLISRERRFDGRKCFSSNYYNVIVTTIKKIFNSVCKNKGFSK